MDIVREVEYDKREKDCPYILSVVLRQKYKHVPILGCLVQNSIMMKKLGDGLRKHEMKTNLIYSSTREIRDFIDKKKLKLILQYLVENKKDGFFVLQHNNSKETRHLVGFLYNDMHKTLDFFDSYETKILSTMRMNKKKIASFIKELFHTYFKDEFIIQNVYEFNQI
jgi:hypothetical protein